MSKVSVQFLFERNAHSRQMVEVMKLIRYAQLTSEPPISVTSDGRIVDGLHRFTVAVLQGRKEIDAVMVSGYSRHRAMYAAIVASRKR
jgi:hypothetical protein